MKIFQKTFSERVRLLRGAQNQRFFAEKLGIPQTTYSNFERGAREPGLQLLGEISTRFGVSVDWLLGLTDERGSGVSVSATGGSAVAAASPGAKVTASPAPASAEVERLRGEVAALERALRMFAGKRTEA